MRFLKVIICAVLTGVILALIFFHNIKKEVQVFQDTSNTVYVFQAGVFKSKDNAYNFASKLDSKLIYYDQEYYRVYIAVIKDYNDITLLKNHFNKKDIDYFIKEITISELPIEFNNYEKLLKQTKQEKAIDKINQEMLNILITYLQ